MAKPKTIADFPQFLASAVSPGVRAADGYVRFEYQGKFDRSIPETASSWFYLLFGEREAVCVTLQLLDDNLLAILTCDEKDQPDLVGRHAAYFPSRWSPYQVWMVAEPLWKWERKIFEGLDAIPEDFESKDISIVDGGKLGPGQNCNRSAATMVYLATTQPAIKQHHRMQRLESFQAVGTMSIASCVIQTSTPETSAIAIRAGTGYARRATRDTSCRTISRS